jgi:voltage-gated potassium channel
MPLTPAQTAARASWQRRWNLPIVLAALVPLFTTSSNSLIVECVIGLGSWVIFVIDLHMQRRIVPDYLHRPAGRVDLAIVLMTFPYYLIPGLSGYTAILMLARLARVGRVLLATAGLQRIVARLGKVAIVAGLVVLFGSLIAYKAEHPANPGFATFSDAIWWGFVTLTTVGYGDIVPTTPTGRTAAIGIMFTGIAVLGVLAGSLASLFQINETNPDETAQGGAGAAVSEVQPIYQELAALGAQLRAVEQSLGVLTDRAQEEVGASGG